MESKDCHVPVKKIVDTEVKHYWIYYPFNWNTLYFQLFWYFIWYTRYGWPLARVRNWNGPAVQQSSTTVSEPKKSSRKYAHCCAPNRPCTNRYLKWLFFQTPDIDTNDAREIHSKLVWLRTKAMLGYKVHIVYDVTFSNFMKANIWKDLIQVTPDKCDSQGSWTLIDQLTK